MVHWWALVQCGPMFLTICKRRLGGLGFLCSIGFRNDTLPSFIAHVLWIYRYKGVLHAPTIMRCLGLVGILLS